MENFSDAPTRKEIAKGFLSRVESPSLHTKQYAAWYAHCQINRGKDGFCTIHHDCCGSYHEATAKCGARDEEVLERAGIIL